MTIVTTVYRPKRPPRKRKPQPAIAQAIVTVKRKPGRFGDVPDLTPEEHQRRGDATDALWRELVRRATGGSWQWVDRAQLDRNRSIEPSYSGTS